MDLGKKIKAIRISEELTQDAFCQLIDIPLVSLKNYELGKRSVNEKNLTKITNHERFKKYTFWLMTGDTLPESGQVSPDFSILLDCGVVDAADDAAKRA